MTKLKDLKLDQLSEIIARKEDPHSVAYTGWLSATGKVEVSPNRACHAGLMSGKNANFPIDVVWSQMQHHSASKEEEEYFVNYMLKESPWKDVFLNEDHKHVKTYGWLADGDADAHMVVNSVVAARTISEWGQRFKFFYKASNEGMSKDLAMILSQFCENGDDNFYVSGLSYHSFAYDCSTEILNRFVNHTPFVVKDRSYRKSPTYKRHCDVWDANPRHENKPSTGAILQEIPQYTMVEKINHNIFYSPKKLVRGSVYHSYKTCQYFEEKVKEKLVA